MHCVTHNAASVEARRGMTINMMIDSNRSSVIDDNHQVFESALDCIKYLACERMCNMGQHIS